MNPSPHQARLGKTHPQTGNLAALQRLLWQALLTAEGFWMRRRSRYAAPGDSCH